MRDDERSRRDAEIRGHAAEQRILEALGAMRPLPEVLDVVVRGLEDQIEHSMCAIVVDRGQGMKVVARGSLPDSMVTAIESLDRREFALGSEGRVTEDFAAFPAHPYRDAALAAGLRSATAIAIHAAGGPVGVLSVQRATTGRLSEHELELAGRAAGIAGVLIERATAEEAVRESEERLRQIADTLREGIWISTIDEELLYVSPSTAAILGVPLDEIYANGMRYLDLVHPDDVAPLARWFNDRVEMETEYRIIRPDGALRWVRSRVVPIRDAAGDVYRFAGVVEDITDAKLASDRLTGSEAHYRRLVLNAPVGIYILDPTGVFTELNPTGETILARPAADVIGRHFMEVVAPQNLAAATELFHAVAAGEDRVTTEVTVVRPSGEERTLALTANPIYENGQFLGLHGIARDVTEERQRELQLRRAERLASVGTLIGGVAHELNNPLTAIRGLSELMLGEEERSADDKEVLGMIRREADRMAKIVSDLRRLARETQESERESKAVDVNEIVRHMLRVRRYTLETSNVEVVEELAEGLPCVWANPAELEQVLLNLVVNAEQALGEVDVRRKRIVVRTRRARGNIALHVVDNGPGIPPELLERIFDPFYTTKAPGGGTGLGLSLVNSIVRDLGGSVRAHSRPGAGAEFVVELPSTAARDAGDATDVPQALHERALRVLVVEDEPTIQSLLRRMLGRRGHEVVLAKEGAEALRLIESADEGEFDVILSDLRMPGLSGEELLRRLRVQNGRYAGRVVFMTGDAVSEGSARIIEDAGVPVLMKPFTLEQVNAIVERVAGG